MIFRFFGRGVCKCCGENRNGGWGGSERSCVFGGSSGGEMGEGNGRGKVWIGLVNKKCVGL